MGVGGGPGLGRAEVGGAWRLAACWGSAASEAPRGACSSVAATRRRSRIAMPPAMLVGGPGAGVFNRRAMAGRGVEGR